MSKHRAFTITSYKDGPPGYDSSVKYLVYQKERCPKTGRLHWQGYVVFNSPRSHNAIKAVYYPDHIEVAKGSPEQNFNYCTKDETSLGSRFEYGTRPNPGSRSDISSFAQAVKGGASDRDLIDQYPGLCAKYPKFAPFVRDTFAERPLRRELVVFAFIGPTGTGKSSAAATLFPDAFRRGGERTWDGYSGQSVCVWDDANLGLFKVTEFLTLSDVWRTQVNVKYGFTYLNYNILVITSNQETTEWYPDCSGVHQRAIDRRVTVLRFEPWRTESEAVEWARGAVLAALPESLRHLVAVVALPSSEVLSTLDHTS